MLLSHPLACLLFQIYHLPYTMSILTVEYMVEGISLSGVACLGIAANILAMRVFAAKKYQVTFYNILLV